MDKKIVQFFITPIGLVVLLYSDGTMLECEMTYTENGIKLQASNPIELP